MSGTMFNGAEIWSTGFWVGHEDADVGEVLPAAASAVATAWQTFFTGNHGFSNAWKTNQIKIARIDQDGSTMTDQVEYYVYGTPITGANGGGSFPPQIAVVGTMISSNVRGLAAKGRMYLPGINYGLSNTDGLIPTTEQGNIANGFNTFLSSVNESADVPGAVILASKGRNPLGFPTVGVNKNVEHIRIGRVYDTQRRRRNALSEQYVSRDTSQDA
jgi:hypothetical protein